MQNKWPERYRDSVKPDSLLILMPAFTLSQLNEAFKIGLLLFFTVCRHRFNCIQHFAGDGHDDGVTHDPVIAV